MAEDLGTESAAARHRPSRRVVTLVAIPLICLVIMSYIGDAFAATLVKSHPVWLMALNSRTRNLALVTNQVDPVTFYVVGITRLLLSDPLFYLLGRWYGDSAVTWMERRTKTWGSMLRRIERWFAKGAYPLLFIAPNNYICLFAGAAGMPIAAFLAVNVAGTVFRLWLVRQFGNLFDRPINALVGWIDDHRLPLVLLSIALVALSIVLEARRGETEVGSLTRLDDELEELDAEKVDEPPPDGRAPGDDGEHEDRRGDGDAA
jgi:membrane protein DedA with SNARE-associated domain